MFCSERSDDFFFFCFLQNRQIFGGKTMYMKRAGDNTGLERTKAECSLPIISKMVLLLGQDPEAGPILIDLIAWAFC